MICLYSGPAKLKPATHVKVRHILCEKQSKALEALEKIEGGEKFEQVISLRGADQHSLHPHSVKVSVLPLSVAHPVCKPYRVRIQVAAAYSEDKARQGGDLGWKSRWDLQDYAAASCMRQNLVAGICISFMSSNLRDDDG
jgi:hypothetical protein